MDYTELSGKSVLLLGKTRSLSEEEFTRLLRLHGIEWVRMPAFEVALALEGRMMNPYEQAESARLYAEGNIAVEALEPLEAWLCRSIEPNRLLMSLKLSKDQERLVDFLANPYITDELFFKLLGLYDWQNEGLFDNDRNRDVTAAIIGRFYADPEKNHNVQYAMSGLAHLIERYGTHELIGAVAALSPIAKELDFPVDRSVAGILDAMALHPRTPLDVLRKLLLSRAALLARREPLLLETELMGRGDVDELLARNPTLSAEGRAVLMERFPDCIARNALLSGELFEKLRGAFATELAANPSLDDAMQDTLMDTDDTAVLQSLAANPSLVLRHAAALMDAGRYDEFLASNPSLPGGFLERLYGSDDPKVHGHLAANPATPIELLYQLSLDRRFERAVKTNPAFGRHIQTHNIGWH
ncbi:MAG: hypothetical protein AB1763_01700 [Campylobacterota bacterium]